MQIFEKLEVSIDFSTNIIINSLASGGWTEMYIPKVFPKFCPNCRENFDKNSDKWQIFHQKI